jgi:hypothetical protein
MEAHLRLYDDAAADRQPAITQRVTVISKIALSLFCSTIDKPPNSTLGQRITSTIFDRLSAENSEQTPAPLTRNRESSFHF